MKRPPYRLHIIMNHFNTSKTKKKSVSFTTDNQRNQLKVHAKTYATSQLTHVNTYPVSPPPPPLPCEIMTYLDRNY